MVLGDMWTLILCVKRSDHVYSNQIVTPGDDNDDDHVPVTTIIQITFHVRVGCSIAIVKEMGTLDKRESYFCQIYNAIATMKKSFTADIDFSVQFSSANERATLSCRGLDGGGELIICVIYEPATIETR